MRAYNTDNKYQPCVTSRILKYLSRTEMLKNGPQSDSKLSWTEARNLVNDLRSQFAVLSEVVPAAVKFRKVSPDRLRIYFLSPLKPGGGSTILYSGKYIKN